MELVYEELYTHVFELSFKKEICNGAGHGKSTVDYRQEHELRVVDAKIYFQTNVNFVKYQQMFENPRVSLVADHISFQHYSHLQGEVLVEVTPKKITLWCYGNHGAYGDFLDMEAGIAYRAM